MSVKAYHIRFTYLDGRKPYSYALEATKYAEANYRFKTIVDRLAQENENGVSRVELKLGNKIINRDARLARPSRYYVVKEKDNNFFALEGRPWGVCVPNSVRRIGNFSSESEALNYAERSNADKGVDKIPTM